MSGPTVGAFNIQYMGVTKMGKADVVQALVKILVRLSLCFVQEVKDADLKVPGQLLTELNEHDLSISGPGDYAMVMSDRLGRSSQKEQYVIYYRSTEFKLVETWQYNDTSDVFERPPYGAVFHTSIEGEGCVKIGILGLHSKPTAAESEVNYLDDVHTVFVEETGVEDVIILGDLNADCSYITSSEMETLDLWTEPKYTWLIDHDVDTTVSNTDCAYDRIIVTGPNILNFVDQGTAAVYRFDQTGILDPSMDPGEVSDHFPVEVTFNSSSPAFEIGEVYEGSTITYNISAATICEIRSQLNSSTLETHGLGIEDGIFSIRLRFKGVKDIKALTEALKDDMPGLFPEERMKQVALDADNIYDGKPQPSRCPKDMKFSNTCKIVIYFSAGSVDFSISWEMVEDV